MLNDVHAPPRLAAISEALGDTWFAWSGPATREPDRDGASYFRVQDRTCSSSSRPRSRAAT